MELNKRFLPALVIGLFWGIIGLSMVTGLWSAQESIDSVEVSTPSDIKGWMTLTDISGYFEIPVDKVKEILNLPTDTDVNTPVKDLGEEEGTDTFRELLNEYLGIPSAENEAPAPDLATGATPDSGDGSGDGSGSEQTLKGRMTFKEVAYTTKVPVAYICEKLGIPTDVDQNVPLRDLSAQYGFEVDDIRTLVEEYR